MQLQIDYEKLKEASEAMKEAANYFSVDLDNSQWSMDLPSDERLLLGDYTHKYIVEKSGCSEEEYARCSSIADKYYRILDFYDNKADVIKRERSYGFERENVPFDVNLTKEQAFEKYCGCDEVTAKKAYDLIDKVTKDAAYHVKGIRESYQGNLFAQLGRESERVEYEERARVQQEKYNAALADMKKFLERPEVQEMQKKFSEGIESYASFVNKTVDDYAKQHDENAAPRL